MAKRRGKISRAAEDFAASLMIFASGAIKGQAKINAKDASAYRAGKWGPADSNKSGSNNSSSGDSGKVISGFLSKIITLLAPAAVLATILASQASGVSVFFNSIKILGNTLGSVLLPVTMLGSAAILTLADTINANLLPNLEKWYTYVLTEGTQLIDKLDKAIVDLINDLNKSKKTEEDAVMQMVGAMVLFHRIVRQYAGGIGDTMTAVGVGNNPVSDFFLETGKAAGIYEKQASDALKFEARYGDKGLKPGDIGDKVKSFLGGLLGPDGKPLSQGTGSIGEAFRKNLKKAIDEMRSSTSPTPQSMGIADAARNAQLAALQMSPFEQETTDYLSKILDSLERANAKLQPGAAP